MIETQIQVYIMIRWVDSISLDLIETQMPMVVVQKSLDAEQVSLVRMGVCNLVYRHPCIGIGF